MSKLDDSHVQKDTSEISANALNQEGALLDSEVEAVNKEHLSIVQWLKSVKFRKQIVGGVNEEDVWKKIHELNEMYEAALRSERIRYDVLLNRESFGSRSILNNINVNDESANE